MPVANRPRIDLTALRRQVARVAAQPAPWLHQEAARRMVERLPLIKQQPARVLDWSAPPGSGVEWLRQAYPQARLSSAGMGAAARSPARPWWRRFGAAPVEVFSEADVPAGGADLLWSNMALHGCADPPALFARWHGAVAVGGFLMFSTLGPGSLPELRVLYARHGWGEAMAPLVDMHDFGDMLVHAGFADPVMDQETLQLNWPDAQALLAELRTLGGNVAPARQAGLRTPRWRQRLLAALTDAAAQGRPALSIELVYGHAFRVAPRPRVQGETPISLHDMRSMMRSPRP
jgi:malonyl-CoA O-methyltransferase